MLQETQKLSTVKKSKQKIVGVKIVKTSHAELSNMSFAMEF